MSEERIWMHHTDEFLEMAGSALGTSSPKVRQTYI